MSNDIPMTFNALAIILSLVALALVFTRSNVVEEIDDAYYLIYDGEECYSYEQDKHRSKTCFLSKEKAEYFIQQLQAQDSRRDELSKRTWRRVE